MPKWTTTTETPETLAALAEELAVISGMFRAVGEQMKVADIQSITVQKADSKVRAMEGIDTFASAARSALREARVSLGQFGVSAVSVSSAASPKTSVKPNKNGTKTNTPSGKRRSASS